MNEMAMAMVSPLPQPHPMMHPESVEYSRYMAALFFAQHDREGSLRAFRHYVPHFVLQTFCTTDRLKAQQLYSAGWYYGDESPVEEADTLVIYDPKTARFDKRHWSECFGDVNIYENYFDNFKHSTWIREQWGPFETLLQVDREIFTVLAEPISQIYQRYQSGVIPIQRGDLSTLRKFFFMMTSLRSRDRNQHLLAKDPHMEDARARRKRFMEKQRLDHPRDVWLQNAQLFVSDMHYDVTSDPDIFDLDLEDYRANARERFVVFWEAGPGEEFVLTDNAFGCFEGGSLGARKKSTVKMTAREHALRTYTRDYMWHQLFVLSPKLVVALCHGTLLHPALTKAHRRRWGLRRSLLEDLPHPVANNYYKDLTKGETAFLNQVSAEIPPEVEKLFGAPRWDGKVIAIENRDEDELVFQVSELTAEQVNLVNCVLLQNHTMAPPVQAVSFRPPTSYRSLHDSLVEFENTTWSKYTEEKQHSYGALQKRLNMYLSKVDEIRSNGSTPTIRPSGGVISPPPEANERPRGKSAEGKKDQKSNRIQQGLPTPPQTQPQSRESSLPRPSANMQRSASSSIPPPPVLTNRAPSSERPTLAQVTEKSVPQRNRALSGDRAAITSEVPSRRNLASSQQAPTPVAHPEDQRRAPSNERRFSVQEDFKVEPPAPPPIGETKAARAAALEGRRPASNERRPSEQSNRADSHPRSSLNEKRYASAQAAQTTHSHQTPPIPELKVPEKRQAHDRSPVRDGSARAPTNPEPEPRTENPKLSREQLEHIERQRRLEQQRMEEQQRREQDRRDQERREQERRDQERREQERRSLEQARHEMHQQHQQKKAALEQQRKDAYNRSRERSSSGAHSQSLEALREQAHFEDDMQFEKQTTQSEVSVDSNVSGSSGSSGSSGPGSGSCSRDEQRVTIRGGSASPQRHPVKSVQHPPEAYDILHQRTQQLRYKTSYDDDESTCGAQSMIVEVDEIENWLDDGIMDQNEFFPKPRKPMVRFASPKPKRFELPINVKAPTTMGSNNKVRYPHQPPQHSTHSSQHPHAGYPPRGEY